MNTNHKMNLIKMWIACRDSRHIEHRQLFRQKKKKMIIDVDYWMRFISLNLSILAMLFIDYLTQFIEMLRFLYNIISSALQFARVFNIGNLGSGLFSGHFLIYFLLINCFHIPNERTYKLFWYLRNSMEYLVSGANETSKQFQHFQHLICNSQ